MTHKLDDAAAGAAARLARDIEGAALRAKIYRRGERVDWSEAAPVALFRRGVAPDLSKGVPLYLKPRVVR